MLLKFIFLFNIEENKWKIENKNKEGEFFIIDKKCMQLKKALETLIRANYLVSKTEVLKRWLSKE